MLLLAMAGTRQKEVTARSQIPRCYRVHCANRCGDKGQNALPSNVSHKELLAIGSHSRQADGDALTNADTHCGERRCAAIQLEFECRGAGDARA